MIKRFLPYYKPYIHLLAIDMSCSLALSGLDLVFPFLLSICIDKYIPAKALTSLMITGVVLLGIILARMIFQYIVTFWGHVMGARMEHDMRNDLFNHIQKLSFGFFDNTKTGYIMSRVVNDLFEVVEVAHHLPEDIFISAIMIAGSIVIMLTFNWMLTVIILCGIPLVVIFSYRYNKKMQTCFRSMREKIAEINARVEDSVAGIRVVQSFTNEELEFNKLGESNRELRDSRVDSFKIMSGFYAGTEFLTSTINIFVFFLAGLFVVYGRLTIGELVAFLFYINLFLNPVRRLLNATEAYQRGLAAFRRFVEIMDVEPDIVDKHGAKPLLSVTGDIAFNQVSFRYSTGAFMLRNINLSVKAGTTVALVGPSGTGKTTICNLIPRFYEIENGNITIDGIDTRMVTLKSLRDRIGLVQQDVFLFSGTVRENIIYGKTDATDEEIYQAAKDAYAHDFILELPEQYDSFIGERGVKLSGGQKQRLSIARMFLKNPGMLILDEATSSLDSESERMIQESIKKLSHGRTTFIIAHRLTTIRNADIILVLTENGIEEQGTHAELIKNGGLYEKLYRTQNAFLML